MEEISENFGIPETTIRELLTFAAFQQTQWRSCSTTVDLTTAPLHGRSRRHQADAMGWSELENGELLRAAQAAGFAVMVTDD